MSATGDELDDEYDDDGEEDYDDVDIDPGAGQAAVDDEEADLSTRVERLAAWEEQLLAYNDKLAEEGWRSWKKGAVTSVMHELQRKVVPDVWRDEVCGRLRWQHRHREPPNPDTPDTPASSTAATAAMPSRCR